MTFPAPRRSALAYPLWLLLLAACGGGGGSSSSQMTPPPPPPPPVAVVTSITPATAVLDRPTDFEVLGTDLNDGMNFKLEGCAGVAEAGGGTKTRRIFSCTPSGTAGSRTLQLYSSASAASSLTSRTIDYLVPVVKAGEFDQSLAVLKADGTLWTWANDRSASTPSNTVITRTRLGSNFTDLEVGDSFGLAISADGKLWAWGSNNDGVFANGPMLGSRTPFQIGEDFRKVAAKGDRTTGGARVVGLKRDGTLWAWGARSSPIPNAADIQYDPHQFGSGFSDLATGRSGGSMALKADGTLWSWNDNISDTPFATKKIGDDFQTVVTADERTFGIKKNGELWAWGRYAPNRLQAGSPDAPVLLGQGFASLSTGANYVVALQTNGTLWVHGNSFQYLLTNIIPVTDLGLTQVATSIRNVWAVSDNCIIIEKRDGTLWGTSRCYLGAMFAPPPDGFHQLPQF